MSDFQIYDHADLERFISNASSPLTLQSVRFETIRIAGDPRILTDLTLFNGSKLIILFAIPCEPDDRLLHLSFPQMVEALPVDFRQLMESQVDACWHQLRIQQNSTLVNGLVQIGELPQSVLPEQPITANGVSERDIPGRAAYFLLLRALRAYQFAQTFIKGKRVLDYGCGSGFGTLLLAPDANALGNSVSRSSEQLPVHAPILRRLRGVMQLDGIAAIQVGNGARDFEDAVESA